MFWIYTTENQVTLSLPLLEDHFNMSYSFAVNNLIQVRVELNYYDFHVSCSVFCQGLYVKYTEIVPPLLHHLRIKPFKLLVTSTFSSQLHSVFCVLVFIASGFPPHSTCSPASLFMRCRRPVRDPSRSWTSSEPLTAAARLSCGSEWSCTALKFTDGAS